MGQTKTALHEPLRELLELSPDPRLFFVDGKVTHANAAARELFRASSVDGLIGRRSTDLLHPECIPAVERRVIAFMQERVRLIRAEEKYVRLDGSPVEVETTVVRAMSFAGKAFILTLRDSELVRERDGSASVRAKGFDELVAELAARHRLARAQRLIVYVAVESSTHEVICAKLDISKNTLKTQNPSHPRAYGGWLSRGARSSPSRRGAQPVIEQHRRRKRSDAREAACSCHPIGVIARSSTSLVRSSASSPLTSRRPRAKEFDMRCTTRIQRCPPTKAALLVFPTLLLAGEELARAYTIPNGGHIYADSGDIYSSEGVLVGNWESGCSGGSGGGPTGEQTLAPDVCSPFGASCTSGNTCCSGQCSWATQTCIDGGPYLAEDAGPYQDPTGLILPRFNAMSASWRVPGSPPSPTSINRELLWIGFQGSPGIIQPELWYDGQQNAWSATVQYGYGGCYTQIQGFNVSPGDQLRGSMEVVAPATTTEGETWLVSISTSDYANYFSMEITVPYGQYFDSPTTANTGVLEVQGISDCGGLPSQNGEVFTITTLAQPSSTNWNFQNSVISLADYTSFSTQTPVTPACNWSTSDSGDYTFLDWSTEPNEPNWSNWDHPFDGVVAGSDIDGTPLISCRGTFQGNSVQVGKTRADWNFCDIGYGAAEDHVTPYETLVGAWTDGTDGSVPNNALPFGTDGDGGPTLYPCRAYLNGDEGYQLGKVRPGFSGCDIPYGGSEQSFPYYQVLTTSLPLRTQSVDSASPPTSATRGRNAALVGGYDTDGAPLYVCQALFNGGLTPGKTRSNWTACHVSWGGQEHVVSSYSVLVPNFEHPSRFLAGFPFHAGTDTNGSALGICRAGYESSEQVGKYLSNGDCDFGFGGEAVSIAPGQSEALLFATSPFTSALP